MSTASVATLTELAISGELEAQYVLAGELHETGQFDAAVGWWRRAAARGHLGAQYNLGVALDGADTDEVRAEAEHWWRLAAGRGHRVAAHNLAILLGERADPDAGHWWLQAAEAGWLEAQFSLGVWYHERGRIDDARVWWRTAAAAGHLDSRYNLAVSLYDGRDYESFVHLRLAAQAGHCAARDFLGFLLGAGETGTAMESH